jgi:hypothetical protein
MLEKYVEERFPRLMEFGKYSTGLVGVSSEQINLGPFTKPHAGQIVRWHGAQVDMLCRLADALDKAAPALFSHIWYGTSLPDGQTYEEHTTLAKARPLYAPLAAAQANSVEPKVDDQKPPVSVKEFAQFIDQCRLYIDPRRLYEDPNIPQPDGRGGLTNDQLDACSKLGVDPAVLQKNYAACSTKFQHKAVTVPSAHAVAELRLVRDKPYNAPKLQQKWMLEFTGEYVWRDVPTVQEYM